MCLPPQDRFYCYPLSPLLQKDVVNLFPGVSDANLIRSNRNRPISKNIINGFCKDLAKNCRVTDWEKCTNHSFRQFCILKLHSLPGVSMAESMALARHNSV